MDEDRRPEGVDDPTVKAVGAVSEALECVERARRELYSFHQLMGHADLLLGEACDESREAGRQALATGLRRKSSAAMFSTDAGRFRSSRSSTTTTGRCSATTSAGA